MKRPHAPLVFVAVLVGAVLLLVHGPALAQLSTVVEADTWVDEKNPTKNYGTTKVLQVDRSPAQRAYLRFRVSGVGSRRVSAAVLRLQIASASSAGSETGGRLHTMSSCTWQETSVTWNTQPTIDGGIVANVGAVRVGEVVRLDLTSAIPGDGTYCFAFESPSTDGVQYNSREASSGRPQLELTVIDGPPTTSTTSTTSTTTPPPATTTPPSSGCGDGIRDPRTEQCDGTAAAACPGTCRADCSCPPVTLAGSIEADVSVQAADPATDFGRSPELMVDKDTAKQAYVRTRVNGVGGRRVLRAVLRLQAADPSAAASDSGGRIHAITDCGWSELGMTWPSRPAIDGPVLAELGPVARRQAVEFDVTGAVEGDGTYCFAIESASADGVTYNSREALAGQSTFALTVDAVGLCGDGVINDPLEACDGTDDAACPGRCRTDCMCSSASTSTTTTSSTSTTTTSSTSTSSTAPPTTSTTIATTTTVTTSSSSTTSTSATSSSSTSATSSTATTSSTTSTTAVPAVCGDGTVNRPAEECDGAADTACPGACLADCTCNVVVLAGLVEADVAVLASDPTIPLGGTATLSADADTAKISFFRVRASGIGARQVRRTILRLQVENVSTAASDSGGRLHTITHCSWDELGMTWLTRPAMDGILLDVAGAVARRDVVDFDVTAAIPGDGTYCLAMDSLSTDGVSYNSREATTGTPQLLLTVSTLRVPVCGDNVVNRASEECDGAEAASCPGACRADCTCADAAECGDGVVNQADEECDGDDNAACPGACQANCTCPAPPVCGDDDINQATEECDGTDAPWCPGACQADCMCAPPVCGDDHVNRASEDCDGADDAACPGDCRADCTCDTALPVGVIEADVSTHEREPDGRFGAATLLWVDADTPKHTFLRVRVRGVGGQPVLRATLHLRVDAAGGAASVSGGRIRQISACTWDEFAMTYRTQPPLDGPVLDEVGAVAPGQAVAFDVTAAIAGDGVYCLALDSASSDGVEYVAREALGGRPSLEVVTPGACGDGRVNGAAEECDGIDDDLCPASCLPDCSCAFCGDDVADATLETCDGVDDGACSGRCGLDCSCPGVPPRPFACLVGDGADITLDGVHLEPYRDDTLPAGTRIDARGAAFAAFPDHNHPINLGGGAGACLAGGTILGQYDRTWTWKQMHDFNNAGVAFANAGFTVDGVRVDNVEDGIRPREGGAFTIRNVWLSYIRDDCVENDRLHGGRVEDSLFDGCYVGFSARPSPSRVDAGMDGSGEVWTIERSLVRLQPMPGPSGRSAAESGHGGFFKWHSWNDPTLSLSPKLALRGNVFMAEQVGEVGGTRMGIPPGQLIDCANNVMVWLGPGPFPAPLPDCFTVTTDRRVWDDAVADWRARHPDIGR